jgi:hypothetical protein
MRIVSFVNPWQRDVIEKILEHGGLSNYSMTPANTPRPAA